MRTHADYLMDCAKAAESKADAARMAGDTGLALMYRCHAARYKADAARANGRPATN